MNQVYLIQKTMKYKNKQANLAARIKEWQASGGMNKESGHLHTKPGSQTK